MSEVIRVAGTAMEVQYRPRQRVLRERTKWRAAAARSSARMGIDRRQGASRAGACQGPSLRKVKAEENC
jgi:hypothetical protein